MQSKTVSIVNEQVRGRKGSISLVALRRNTVIASLFFSFFFSFLHKNAEILR